MYPGLLKFMLRRYHLGGWCKSTDSFYSFISQVVERELLQDDTAAATAAFLGIIGSVHFLFIAIHMKHPVMVLPLVTDCSNRDDTYPVSLKRTIKQKG